MLELIDKLEWLESHNKNYTKQQYFKIQECLELAITLKNYLFPGKEVNK